MLKSNHPSQPPLPPPPGPPIPPLRAAATRASTTNAITPITTIDTQMLAAGRDWRVRGALAPDAKILSVLKPCFRATVRMYS